MPKYLIVEPCLYVTADGKVVQHREAGSVVELPAETAVELGLAVKELSDARPEVPETEGSESPRPRGPRGRRHGAAEPAEETPEPGVVTKDEPEVRASDG